MLPMRSAVQMVQYAGCAAVLMLALMLAAASGRAAEPVKVFLLGGQSNMDGRALTSELPTALQAPQDDVPFYTWELTTLRPGDTYFGPEVTFGRTVADAFGTETFALIKYAAGGTNLHDDWNPASGDTYATFRDRVTDGMAALTVAGYDPQIVGMLWTQGERDTWDPGSGAQYEADLNNFIADVRTRYGTDLPFFLSRLSSGQTSLQVAGLAEIRTAQADVAAADPLAYMIDTDGMGLLDDDLHFDASGQIALGEAFGQAYVNNSVPEPGTLGLVGLGVGAALWHRRRR
ncbi:MAG: PEP-CTERM sorting domain-containing protein [Anaerolineaceae bacterium]|nr:PEP-CTERM sorting domain-containing protein [Anaerolineaceae bacterium]